MNNYHGEREDFSMDVLEIFRSPLADMREGEAIVTGPVESGTCKVGDLLQLISRRQQPVTSKCTGIELLNRGRTRRGWISLKVSVPRGYDIEGTEQVRAIN
jgi:translation elongation factor EF-Tu-like GTPase